MKLTAAKILEVAKARDARHQNGAVRLRVYTAVSSVPVCGGIVVADCVWAKDAVTAREAIEKRNRQLYCGEPCSTLVYAGRLNAEA